MSDGDRVVIFKAGEDSDFDIFFLMEKHINGYCGGLTDIGGLLLFQKSNDLSKGGMRRVVKVCS